jgi:hypothetical protein
MSTIINIFAFVGFIFLLGVLIYYAYKYFKHKQLLKDISLIYPPGDYMQQTGIKCPDYWVNSGSDSNGNYECQNRFNVPVVKNSNPSCANVKCTATNDNTKAYFNSVPRGKTWEYGNPDGLKSMTDQDKYDFVTGDPGSATANRCNWINCCGGSSGTKSSWTGVYEVCQNPDPSQVAK